MSEIFYRHQLSVIDILIYGERQGIRYPLTFFVNSLATIDKYMFHN